MSPPFTCNLHWFPGFKDVSILADVNLLKHQAISIDIFRLTSSRHTRNVTEEELFWSEFCTTKRTKGRQLIQSQWFCLPVNSSIVRVSKIESEFLLKWCWPFNYYNVTSGGFFMRGVPTSRRDVLTYYFGHFYFRKLHEIKIELYREVTCVPSTHLDLPMVTKDTKIT